MEPGPQIWPNKNCSGAGLGRHFLGPKKRASRDGSVRDWAICELGLIWPAEKGVPQQTFHLYSSHLERIRKSVSMAIFTEKSEGDPATAVRGPMVVMSSVCLQYAPLEIQRTQLTFRLR